MPLQKVLIVSNTDRNILLFRRALIKALQERGLEVHLCVPPGNHGEELQRLGATLCYYPLARGSLNPFKVPPSVLTMRRLLGTLQPDVIHSFTHQANILTRLSARSKDRVVHTITGLGSGFMKSGATGLGMRIVFKQLYKATSSRCQAVVFQNETDQGFFEDNRLLGKARSACIKGSGVDTQRFRCEYSEQELHEVRASLGLGPEEVLCTMTARLLYDKGVMEYLQAARQLHTSCPHARFLIVGDRDKANTAALSDADMDRLRSQPNLILPGWRDDMPRIWCASDIAVLPSYREGLPMSLQEAMACGLPVVTTDVPGCREIVEDGDHGLLVPAAAVEELAQALQQLIQDRERRLAMGKASRERAVRVFDGRKIAREHIALYEELVNAP